MVVPPSRRSEGRYEWVGASILDVDLPAIPDDLLSLLQSRAPSASSVANAAGKIAEGGRNNELASIAGTLRRRGLDVEEIEAALQGINRTRCNPPLPEDEVARIARSISSYPPAGRYELTELGNARRLVDSHGEGIRYCPTWGKWLVWDGQRWTPDDTGEVERRAKQVALSIKVEADALTSGMN